MIERGLTHDLELGLFDPFYPNIGHSYFWECDWTYFYEGAVEAIPLNAPPPTEKKVDLHIFIDSNHASNKCTKTSMTVIMIYMNK